MDNLEKRVAELEAVVLLLLGTAFDQQSHQEDKDKIDKVMYLFVENGMDLGASFDIKRYTTEPVSS